ncbi:MAG: GGDEF domain-containing protein [Clostridia bacterium]|nr:GGDEF domain-containing protein [Clostridia bacterium]
MKSMSYFKLDKKDKEAFYQSQYNYYQRFNLMVVIVACLASTTYFISDCQLFDRFAFETILPRFAILIPLLIYIYLQKRCKNYKIMVPFSLLIPHLIMWGTIGAIWFLPDRSHAREGFIIIQLVFLVVSFAAPPLWASANAAFSIANILLSNLFIHYEEFDLMMSLNIPMVFGMCLVVFVITDTYYEHYVMKNELEASLMQDPLTRVFNRNKIESLINDGKDLLSISKNITIMMLDIDFFKRVNDVYGHDKGDEILQFIAEHINQSVRKNDVVIRWGGEEFVIIMFDCKPENAFGVAEKMRKSIEEADNHVCKITVSVGIAFYVDDYEKTVKRADEALYHAKQTGRNKVVSYGQMLEEKAVNNSEKQ